MSALHVPSVAATVPERLNDLPFWTDGPTLSLGPLIWLGVFVAMVAGGWYVRRRWPHWRRDLEPVLCFVQIARSNGVGWSDIWLLWRLAHHCRLTTPLTLLICDATLTAHADARVNVMSRSAGRRLLRRIEAIRERLFESALPDEAHAA